MKHKDIQDVLGGLGLAALGVFAAVYAQRYEFGDLNRMGAGYFPVTLGALLAVLGLMIAVPAFFRSGPAIKVHPDVGPFTHQHDMMPRFHGQGGFAGEQLIGFVVIEKNQPALGSRQMGAADAEVFARRGGVAVPPAPQVDTWATL